MKLTKNELRSQQSRLLQLTKYLPTLQLKKAMLQSVVMEARLEVQRIDEEIEKAYSSLKTIAPLLAENQGIDFQNALRTQEVVTTSENIAGIDVPHFKELIFHPYQYSFFSTPVWVCQVLEKLKDWKSMEANRGVIERKKKLLEEELRQVAIRVNLFEKVLIPRHIAHIKKIKVLLSDLGIAEISRAKAAKTLLDKKNEALL